VRNNQKSKILNQKSGFTLVELLVVCGIIVLLIAISIPVIGKVKSAAQEADTRGLVQALDGAIQNYYSNFKAYPGPIPNSLIYKTDAIATEFGFAGGFKITQSAGSGFDTAVANETALRQNLSGAENLVLGLLGGLKVNTSGGNPTLEYDPTLVGNGPLSLNPSNPKKYGALGDPTNLSWRTENNLKTGKFEDEAGSATDTIIPEFVDKFTSGPMPILYLRARPGAKHNAAVPISRENNGVINQWSLSGYQYAKDPKQQYDLDQIVSYTRPDASNRSIGQGKTVKQKDYTVAADYLLHGLRRVSDPLKSMDKTNANYEFPYDAYPYFTSPTAANTARNKDGFILISAGKDRVYGTDDDITNFGPVKQ
jgi:type II secretory pathway pseudopilin PulG